MLKLISKREKKLYLKAYIWGLINYLDLLFLAFNGPIVFKSPTLQPWIGYKTNGKVSFPNGNEF